MGNRKKASLFLTIGIILFVLVVLSWFVFSIFEGESPRVILSPRPEYLSETRKFSLSASDMKRGLRDLTVVLSQEGRRFEILKKSFPFTGLFNREGTRSYHTEFSVDPSQLNLSQGRADLAVRVWDYSRRRGGDGNMTVVHHKMIVDTIPPAIRAVSRLNYITVGGTCLVVYQTSSDAVESGIFVGDLFFKGYPAIENSQEGYHVCYFTVPPTMLPIPEISLGAVDRAGNSSRTGFYYHIRRKRFRTVRMNITDRFLQRVLPRFSSYGFDPGSSDIDKFLKINRQMRKENARTFFLLKDKSALSQLWQGRFLRLKNAATMAGFGDRRLYYYHGKKIDEQVHMGVDLASLANSQVRAANNGRVIYADRLGIYGNTVVIDHGQGVASAYSHLSRISVENGQEVVRGSEIGLTGQSGLAGGDHLHFAILVNGRFVDPVEWWDGHWIEDNINKKLARLGSP